MREDRTPAPRSDLGKGDVVYGLVPGGFHLSMVPDETGARVWSGMSGRKVHGVRSDEHVWDDVIDDATRKVYAPYVRERRIGTHPALLLIDLYNLVFEGGAKPPAELVATHPSSCGVYAHDAIGPIQRLLRSARDAKLPIAYSTSESRADASPVGWATARGGKRAGPSAFEIHEAFAPGPEDLVIRKQRASAFYGSPLAAYLVMRGCDSVIVCGESTSGCVRASSVDAFSNGFHVTVVEECVFDRSLITHKVNLFDLHQKYADVMHLDEVEEALRRRV